MVNLSNPPLSMETGRDALQPLYVCCIAFIFLNTLAFVCRFVSRLGIRRLQIGWDDITIIPAYLCTIAVSILGLLIVRYETQRQTFAHIPIIEPSILEPTLKCIWAIPLVTIPIESLTRMSICFLYLRIFTNRAIRACCWALIAFLMACWAAYGITSIFQCYPVGHFWNRFTSTGSCFDSDNFYRSVSPPFILADLLIILLPLPVVWRLKSSNTRKLGLTLLFGIGVLAVIASCGRLWQYSTHTTKLIRPDLTGSLLTWIVVEAGLYHIAAQAPASHHLLALMIPLKARRKLEKKIAAAHQRLPSLSMRDRTQTSSRMALRAPSADEDEFEKMWGAPMRSKGSASACGHRASENPRIVELGNVYGINEFSPTWDGVRRGEGILVHNEVIVTQEERIQSIIGF